MSARLKIWLFLMGYVVIGAQLTNESLIVFTVVVLGVAAAISWRKHLGRVRQWRIDNRLCTRCEYDLRGIASRRCPECGEPIPGSNPGAATPTR
jgi:hypothetical protein